MSLDKDIELTPHFKLSEFLTHSDHVPVGEVLLNLRCLANRLQVMREVLNRPITITSGYRSPEHNRQVGGVQDSFHTRGMAADIVVEGLTPRQVQAYLKNWSGGLGSYDTHTHVDIRPYKARWDASHK